MNREADKNTRRFSRRVFVLIGVLLLLLAAASPTPTPLVIPKPVTVCFKDRLDLRASADEVFQGAAVTFSTPGVNGGSNYSAVNYQWKSSAGKLISKRRRLPVIQREQGHQNTSAVPASGHLA